MMDMLARDSSSFGAPGSLTTATAAFAFGALLGVVHFRSLALNARLFAEGALARALILQAGRFALVVGALIWLVRLGASALLAGALGLVVARAFVLRLMEGSP